MRPLVRINPSQAYVLDAHLLTELGAFVVGSVQVGLKSNTLIRTVRSPATGVHRGVLGKRQDVQHGGPDLRLPASRKRDLGRFSVLGHSALYV